MSASSFFSAPKKQMFAHPPRVLVIGAGARGTTYAWASLSSTNAIIAGVCEPIAHKRVAFGQKFIWKNGRAQPHHEFNDWRQWVQYEETRRKRERAGEKVERGIDAVFVCVLDELHETVVTGIAGLGVHICCEKPMSTSLESCGRMWRALKGVDGDGANGEMNGLIQGGQKKKEAIFGICHVLRYTPHNMLLRHLVLEKNIIGDVLSVEHVEPVGNWHFSHSYVRGNWRKESTTAPSLLTKSCHDIDFLLWMLCSPASSSSTSQPHLPSFVTSTGSRKFFRKERKPAAAGDATNCLSCAYEQDCTYSAKRIYLDKHLKAGHTGWPVRVVTPDIEEIYKTGGQNKAVKQLISDLRADYTVETPVQDVEARTWYGRCVYEADNDVCDDQCVTITWDEDAVIQEDGSKNLKGRGPKTAQFHMVAFTEKVCQRRGRIYGTKGEIEYDSSTIKVYNFSTRKTKIYTPHAGQGGHGGGDQELARQFLMAVESADSGKRSVADAQRKFLGCDVDEAFLSHAMVFAAEEARKERKVVDWGRWWEEKVEPELHGR